MGWELIRLSKKSKRTTVVKSQDKSQLPPRRSSLFGRVSFLPKIRFRIKPSIGNALFYKSESEIKSGRRRRTPMVRDPYLTVLETTDSTDEFSEDDMSDMDSVPQSQAVSSSSCKKGRTGRRRRDNQEKAVPVFEEKVETKRTRRGAIKHVNNLDETHHRRRRAVHFACEEPRRDTPKRDFDESEYRSWVLWTKACKERE